MAHNRPRPPGNAGSLHLEKYTSHPSVSLRSAFPTIRRRSKLRAFGKLCTLDDTNCGGAGAPVILPAFKAGDSALRESNGGFDSHTLPPFSCSVYAAYRGRESSSSPHVAYSPLPQP